jgi:stage V sporulation protein D (sporulation-specific penicillin-binding protein)
MFTLAQPDRDRVPFLLGFFVLLCLGIFARLFVLQVVQAPYYDALAQGQRALVQELLPERGEVFVRDVNTGEEFPLATNQELEFIYVVPREVENIDETVLKLAGPLKLDQAAQDELKARLQDKADLYEPVKRQVEPKVWDEISAFNLAGVHAEPEEWPIYPEGNLAAQVSGYVGFVDDGLLGQYGIQGYFNEELSGTTGEIESETDSAGRRIVSADSKVVPANDGSDIVLTIDRTIQHLAQEVLENGVKKYQADHGDITVMDPASGDILAMASAPTFDPNKYQDVKDISVFKNTAIFDTYEPGSTFKVITMAAALDAGLVTPETTFVDRGCRKVDVYNICNFDKGGPGIITATGALERSSNVAMSQISEKVGRERFYDYLVDFGFTSLTGITLDNEAEVGVSKPDEWVDSQLATIGFGQGISTTPLHLIMAQSAIANDGKMMEPHIVKEIRHPDGTVEKFEPKIVEEVIKPSAALELTAMLVSAVENGVADQARLDDYTVAGKTGTAQVARADGLGYDGSKWIASFMGYGPIPNPRAVILIRLVHPKASIHGANTAAPMFKELAPQIFHYLRIPGNRENKSKSKP